MGVSTRSIVRVFYILFIFGRFWDASFGPRARSRQGCFLTRVYCGTLSSATIFDLTVVPFVRRRHSYRRDRDRVGFSSSY